jgi:hypothetical protein
MPALCPGVSWNNRLAPAIINSIAQMGHHREPQDDQSDEYQVICTASVRVTDHMPPISV